MIKVKDVYFLKSCTKIKHFPIYTHPEFAFLGRSNVGKSSLINMLMNRKDLVKTGSKPGVTKTINFFILNEKISIVDLPGYGYAKLPKNLRDSFLPLIKDYLKSRDNLKLAFLLIDIRRVPDTFEQDIIEIIHENDVPVAILLTKCDKLSKNQRKKNVDKIIKVLEIDKDSVFYSSAQNGEGKKDILKLIDEFTR